jgi:hypothetical protein
MKDIDRKINKNIDFIDISIIYKILYIVYIILYEELLHIFAKVCRILDNNNEQNVL